MLESWDSRIWNVVEVSGYKIDEVKKQVKGKIFDGNGAIDPNNYHLSQYLSAHKHHQYWNGECDGKPCKYTCDENLDGGREPFLPDLQSIDKAKYALQGHPGYIGDSRWNNVGEPDKHPDSKFVNCLWQFPSKVTREMCEEVDCKNGLNDYFLQYIFLGFAQYPGDPNCENGKYLSVWGDQPFYTMCDGGDSCTIIGEMMGDPFVKQMVVS